eukprot:283853_1
MAAPRAVFFKVDDTTKKISGVASLDDLKRKAEKAFGCQLEKYVYQEELARGEGTLLMDVDLETDDDLFALKPNQLVAASKAATASASTSAPGIPGSERGDGESAPVQRVLGNPLKVSLSKVEYAQGISAE